MVIISSDLLQKYYNTRRRLGLSERTYKTDRHTLTRLQLFLGDKPITKDYILSYVDHIRDVKKWKKTSQKNEVMYIRPFIAYLFKESLIETDFSSEIKPPTIKRNYDFPYYDPDTVISIIYAGTEPHKSDNSRNKEIKKETRAALLFMFHTALRVNECLTLKGSDIRIKDKGFWVNSKGGNRDFLSIPEALLPDLTARIHRKYVYSFTAATANKALKRGAIAIGESPEIHVHMLRKLRASNLVKNLVPIQHVSKLLRHSDPSITSKIYAHLDIKDISYAMNLPFLKGQNSLSHSQMFDYISDSISKLNIEEDGRFETRVDRVDGEYLTVTVKVRK